MIFLDTSGILAMADIDDKFHDAAVRAFEAVQRSEQLILTHSYVLVESASLIQRRLGLTAALRFLAEAEAFDVRWVSHDMHIAAVEELDRRNRQSLSLVDVTSFLVMNAEAITTYLGFDKHFVDEGFRQVQEE